MSDLYELVSRQKSKWSLNSDIAFLLVLALCLIFTYFEVGSSHAVKP